ncbi:hypothetical protein CTI12_AA523820 [Artemisia annua]|uniref:Rapid ALkalinization Factor n=1 Tax=Artemisia annua TaxID=35608 RepID=A0A2U1L6J0_ARTAN|nr:hypothetical protein CTI12_AA523820 [Artemisia annua]
MKISSSLIFLTLLIISAAVLRPAAASAGSNEVSWLRGGECSGSIAECMTSGEEFEMESGSARHLLQAATRHISYDALQGNNVPCSQRGASYYNCRSGGQANPYQRGCSTITRCRRALFGEDMVGFYARRPFFVCLKTCMSDMPPPPSVSD